MQRSNEVSEIYIRKARNLGIFLTIGSVLSILALTVLVWIFYGGGALGHDGILGGTFIIILWYLPQTLLITATILTFLRRGYLAIKILLMLSFVFGFFSLFVGSIVSAIGLILLIKTKYAFPKELKKGGPPETIIKESEEEQRRSVKFEVRTKTYRDDWEKENRHRQTDWKNSNNFLSISSQSSKHTSYISYLTFPRLKEVSPSMRNIIPNYKITHKIGSGGSATVYLSEGHRGKHFVVKLPKFIDETVSTSVLEQFKAEANMWKNLKHKNIVKFEIGDVIPLPYLVIEFMDGGNLKELITQCHLNIQEALDIMLQILDGMSFAHKMASVHRDIKPENLLFTKDGILKISDWGIGKFMASTSSTMSSGTKGTLAYSAPEQISQKKFGKVDWSTDIFQLGIVFYEMLTGKNPFYVEDPAGIVGNILYEHVDPPSSVNPQVPSNMDDIVMKALEKRKENRWRSVDIMYHELAKLKNNQ